MLDEIFLNLFLYQLVTHWTQLLKFELVNCQTQKVIWFAVHFVTAFTAFSVTKRPSQLPKHCKIFKPTVIKVDIIKMS